MNPIAALKHIYVSFGGVQALSDISFQALDGHVTSVIGPNGAGKTTAINCLSGLLRPQGGEALFGGRSISGLAIHQMARLGVARTFQSHQVFAEMTVLENVMLGLHACSKKDFLAALFRLPGLKEEERRIEEQAQAMLERMGLMPLAEVPAGQLSHGQQKRVEIARALVGRPKLVLLDEPAAGLNRSETREMGRLIKDMRGQGVSVILVEHDMELVMDISDQVVVLNYGRKIAEGSPAEVREHSEVIEAYLGNGEEDLSLA